MIICFIYEFSVINSIYSGQQLLSNTMILWGEVKVRFVQLKYFHNILKWFWKKHPRAAFHNFAKLTKILKMFIFTKPS